jgi:RNA polymerase sigma factor (sigma-70 family)
MAEASDDFHDLVQRLRDGSEDAARELVERYGMAIRRAVRRALDEKLRPKFDSLDFVQVVWNSFFRVPGKMERISSPQELMKYLLAMARHKVNYENRRFLHRQNHNVNREVSLERLQAHSRLNPASHDPGPEDVAVAHEQWERLLEGQPARCRQIIHLRLQGYSFTRIGEQLQMSERTVRRVLNKLLHISLP